MLKPTWTHLQVLGTYIIIEKIRLVSTEWSVITSKHSIKKDKESVLQLEWRFCYIAYNVEENVLPIILYTTYTCRPNCLVMMHIHLDGNDLVKLLADEKHDVHRTVASISLDPRLEQFQMYKSALRVYKAAKGEEKLPLDLKQSLNSNRRLKQRIYHLVFEVMHCKFFRLC